MTATVVQFPPRASIAPTFNTIGEALLWFTAWRATPTTKPPLDGTGDDLSDSYLATIFAGLLHMRRVSDRIAHLHVKADEQDRHTKLLTAEGHPGAGAHVRLRDTLRRWATQLCDAATEQVSGGAA